MEPLGLFLFYPSESHTWSFYSASSPTGSSTQHRKEKSALASPCNAKLHQQLGHNHRTGRARVSTINKQKESKMKEILKTFFVIGILPVFTLAYFLFAIKLLTLFIKFLWPNLPIA